jgi:hypothetical protein
MLRYIGTLSRKSYATQNLNIPNFRSNGLLAALDAVRRGDDANTGLLDQIFNGVKLCATNHERDKRKLHVGFKPWFARIWSNQWHNARAAVQIRAGGLPASGFHLITD